MLCKKSAFQPNIECQLFLCTPYYSAVVWPHKNWGMVWHLWQIHNSCPPYLWEQKNLWREHCCYNGAYLPADLKLGSSCRCRCLLELFRKHTPCVHAALYPTLGCQYGSAAAHILICQCILWPTKFVSMGRKMQMPRETQAEVYLQLAFST